MFIPLRMAPLQKHSPLYIYLFFLCLRVVHMDYKAAPSCVPADWSLVECTCYIMWQRYQLPTQWLTDLFGDYLALCTSCRRLFLPEELQSPHRQFPGIIFCYQLMCFTCFTLRYPSISCQQWELECDSRRTYHWAQTYGFRRWLRLRALAQVVSTVHNVSNEDVAQLGKGE